MNFFADEIDDHNIKDFEKHLGDVGLELHFWFKISMPLLVGQYAIVSGFPPFGDG